MKIHPRFWRDGDLDWDVIKEKNECNQVLVKLTLCIWYVFELLKIYFEIWMIWMYLMEIVEYYFNLKKKKIESILTISREDSIH